MNVILIYNDTSGGEFTLRKLRPLFKRNGITIDYSFTIKQLTSRKLRSLIAKGVTVATVGGDGTLNAVARMIVGTPSTFMPLPGGTFNHFIRDVGVVPNLEEALTNVRTSRVAKIDVAYVNDELFLNNSNLGLYPFSLIERKTTKKYIGKYGAAVLSAIDQLSIFRRHHLTIDGQRVRSPFVFIGNNIYDIEASLIPSRSRLTDGLLTVMIATSPSRLSLIRDVFAVVRGDVSRRDDFNVSTRKELTVYARRQTLPVSLDGEVKRLKTPLMYRIAPKALRIRILSTPVSES